MRKRGFISILTLFAMIAIAIPPGVAGVAQGQNQSSTDAVVNFTIIHTNDFHGNLEPAGSNPGMARLAQKIIDVRAEVGDDNVLLLDAGDIMQGTLLSNLFYGESTIDVFNYVGYQVATFGNHEFDWSLDTLISRTVEADFPFVTSNIVISDTGNCDTAGWETPDFAIPWITKTVGTDPDTAVVGILGVTTQETPYITIAGNTAGLCFKDPADSISHYYQDVIDAGADVVVILSHLGYTDGGYGYGFPVYGDQTLAQKLIDAGTPVNLIIGGHTHTNLTVPTIIGDTYVVQAYYAGRRLGRADITFNTDTSEVGITWESIVVGTGDPQDPGTQDQINQWANDPWYLSLINQPVGYAQTDLLRNYNGDAMMGDFVDDAIYNYLNNDSEMENDVDLFFNNAGGIRIDWCDKEDPANPGEYIWSSDPIDCSEGLWAHDPMLLTYGQMFQILPFGNSTIVGDMTGAQILDLINQSATLFKGAIQPSGIRYSFYRYSDANPGPQPWAWGGYGVEVYNKDAQAWEPLDLERTYRVGTNEFLAPAGQDGYIQFKYMTNISYWGDMLNAVNDWVENNYTFADPYKGPDGDGTLDGRVTRDGDDTSGSIVPITILHNNDSHGHLVPGSNPSLAQLATIVNQERLHNPDRTLLLNAGDQIQGDSMMYYFKSAGLGYAADGTPLPSELQIHPMIAAMNAMDYDAMTLGNHEYNFGHTIFTSTLDLATFPILQANVEDDGQYGIDEVPVEDYVIETVGPENISVAILGIGNHRIPNYELPSNIPGLTFGNPLEKAQELSDELRSTTDVLIALSHIGFTQIAGSVEVDNNVDTEMAMQTTGLDAIIGGHSHTDPSKQTLYSGAYKFLPTLIGDPDNNPVLVTQMYRYNNYLGEVIIGLTPDGGGGYDVVSRAGRYIKIDLGTVEDPTIKAIIDPYNALLQDYNNTIIGQTTVPLDALDAFTQETNGANLQADSAVWELADQGIDVDFYLSGAMTNQRIADGATITDPITLTVSDMFTLMPYENSLVTMNLNGPQLKTLLERGYRNYYYYKYVPGYGGYSHYTTCMLDVSSTAQITYADTYPFLPNGNNVVSLTINGVPVDFTDDATFYHVATVNYLAAGSCNFNDDGQTLWPLDQIVYDTQYYVRDSVINYIMDMEIISPAIEGRLSFVPSVSFLFMPFTVK
ncbi:MAG: 5'-nucleotidase C-terminal domain-containing protein [Anaerolineales bacterium]